MRRINERRITMLVSFVVGIIVLTILSVSGIAAENKRPLLLNFYMHTNDPINVQYSPTAIKKVVEMYASTVGKADLYFTPNTAYSVGESKVVPELPSLIKNYLQSGWGLGILFNAPHPEIRNTFATLSWDNGWKMIMKYKTQYQDKITGQFDPSRDGGEETLKRVFGQGAHIALRQIPENAYYHRNSNAIITLGGHPDFLDNACKGPMAWFMGMLAIISYDVGAPSPRAVEVGENYESEVRAYLNLVPRDRPQFIYRGLHNVDLYADNDKWNAADRGHPRHVERIGYSIKENGEIINPTSLEAARIPPEFILSQQRRDEILTKRTNVLKAFAKIASEDPTIHIVSVQDLHKFIVVEENILLDKEDLSLISQFIDEKSRRGLPEYIEIGEDYLTLAEGYQGLAIALAQYNRTGELPGQVTESKNVLGPVV